jgi:RNA polymerase sigma factor (sigma-70 family)
MTATCLELTRTTADTRSSTPDRAGALDVFLLERSRLLGIAYRITGGPAGAEDIVQEAWLRWQRTDQSKIKNAAAFLTTTTTNLAINVIQSARYRRESSAGTRLAAFGGSADDPTRAAEQAVEIEEALALLRARLTPDELAAFLLRKGFDYAYADIAGLLGTSTQNARKLVSRAGARLPGERRQQAPGMAHRLLVAAFLAAARTGDLEELEQLLTRTTEQAA